MRSAQVWARVEAGLNNKKWVFIQARKHYKYNKVQDV